MSFRILGELEISIGRRKPQVNGQCQEKWRYSPLTASSVIFLPNTDSVTYTDINSASFLRANTK